MLKRLLCEKVMEKGVADIIINMKKDMEERYGETSFNKLPKKLPSLFNTLLEGTKISLMRDIILYLKENHNVKSEDKITYEISEMRNIKPHKFTGYRDYALLYDFDFFLCFNVKGQQIKITFDMMMKNSIYSGKFLVPHGGWRVKINDSEEKIYSPWKAKDARWNARVCRMYR